MSDCFASREVIRCIAKAKTRKRYKLAQVVKTYLDTDAVPPAAFVRASVWQNPAQWRSSGEVELTAVCRWNARSSLDPAAGRDVKTASARSLVREDLWRRLRVRRLAWGVPGRRRQREAGEERSWLREAANCSCVELSGQASENDIRHSDELFGRHCSQCVIRSCVDAGVGALRSRRTVPAKVTAEERLSEQRLGQLVVPYALELVAAVEALRSRRTAPAKVTGKKGLASRELYAKLERD